MNALETKNLTIQFGGLKAVSNVSLSVPSQTIFGLIGPNGAGKTTFFNMITGVYEPTSGSISAFGHSIEGKTPYDIVRKGLARTFQNIRLFKSLSVLDNLMIALDQNPDYTCVSTLSTLFRTKAAQQCENAKRDKAHALAKIFHLENKLFTSASNLPYGDQRRLEIARAMATGAKLILLDEPAAGMNPNETAELTATIRSLRDQHHLTVLLIEHDMRLVMDVCERIAVLDYGQLIAEGAPSEIQKNPAVIEAYLGKGSHS